MKKILSTTLAIALFFGVQAQDGGKEKTHGKHGDMFKELNLTADQQAKIKSIRDAEKTEMKGLKGDKNEANKDARKQLHEKYKTQFDAVLTADQKAKLDVNRKQGRGEKSGRGDRKDGMREFGKNLDLSADQKTRISSINSEFKTKMGALKSNTALTQEQKKEQFKQLAESHKNSLKSVLTAEQASKMEKAKKNHKNKESKNL